MSPPVPVLAGSDPGGDGSDNAHNEKGKHTMQEGETVTLTLTTEEWRTLAAAAQLGAERQSEQAREIARLYGLSPEVARQAFTAGKSWTVIAAVRLALAGVTA